MKSVVLDDLSRTKSATPGRLLFLRKTAEGGEGLLAELREAGWEVQHKLAAKDEEFLDALRKENFDAIVADYDLGSWTGLDALREVRRLGKDIPFVLRARTTADEAATGNFEAGSDDWLVGKNSERLSGVLKRALEEKKLRNENARAKEQLAEMEMIYRTAPIGLAVYGPDLRYLRVNEYMARINGVPAEQHQGLMTRDINPDIARAIEPYLRRAFSRGESILNVEIHGTTQARAGVERDWLASFHPLRGANGVLFGISVVAQEITERKRSEAALAESEARNRDIVDNSREGIFRISREGTFLNPNPALVRMLGYESAKELKAVKVQDIFRYPADYVDCMARCSAEGQTCDSETQWRRRDGALVTVRLRLRGLAGNLEAGTVEGVAEDVTEVRAIEEQLQHSQKFEAIGQLAGGVAHDFNNVVGAILGWAELGLEQSRSHPQIAERFSRIREQADRAATLTRELLAFARRQVLQPRMIDLNSVASNMASFLAKVLRKDIELRVVNAPVEALKADPGQIEQVLMNLCLNARDAMPQGGRLVIETEMADVDEAFCRFYPQAKQGRYAVVSVSDTGVGMDAATRDRVFEPFFSTKEQGKSSGMGLATAYGVVKQHGGFIHVYSELGQGTLFRVYLPVRLETEEKELGKPAGKPALAERGTETLLIAEDHDSIREMARQTLTGLGYRVLAAVDGEEAWRLCEGEEPALAILDLVMPKLGGPEAAAKLATRYTGIPILFTSGYSQEAKRPVNGFANARFLQKPYSPSNLGRIVREILDEARHGAGKR